MAAERVHYLYDDNTYNGDDDDDDNDDDDHDLTQQQEPERKLDLKHFILLTQTYILLKKLIKIINNKIINNRFLVVLFIII